MKRKLTRIISLVLSFALLYSLVGVLPQFVTAADSTGMIDEAIVLSESEEADCSGEIPEADNQFGYSLEGAPLPFDHDSDVNDRESMDEAGEEAAEQEIAETDFIAEEPSENGTDSENRMDEESAGDEKDRIEDRIPEDLEEDELPEEPEEGEFTEEPEDGELVEEGEVLEEVTEAAAYSGDEEGTLLASGGCGQNLSWTLSDNGTLTVSGSGEMKSYSTSSPAPWSENLSQIQSVVIEDGVTSVGKLAFYDCPNLTSLQLPSTLVRIGEMAFYLCSSLGEVHIPGSITTLDTAAFAGCNLSVLTGGEGLVTVGNYAFQDNPLSEFAIPASLEHLSGLAFYGCNGLQRFTGGSSVYQVVDGVLFTGNGTTLYKYPSGKAGAYAIPEGVVTIADQAFITCEGLSEVTIPSTTSTLGSSAFQGCSALKSIEIPDSVTSAGYFTFYECSSLESATIGSGLKTAPYEMFMYCTMLKSIDFGGLEELDNRAFFGCSGLQEITIPATIKKVGAGAFYGCSGLKKVEYFAECEYIPAGCFSICFRLQSVSIKEGIKYIYAQAFYGATSLSTVTLPSTMVHCVDTAFPASVEIQFAGDVLSPYGTSGYVRTDRFSLNGTQDYEEAYRVLEIVNQKRAEAGLSALYMDEDLLAAATQRSAETAFLFSHTRPNSTVCFTACTKMTAENIAAGQSNAEYAMDSWMNSSGHRDNILEPSSTSIGIGCFKHNGMTYWVQCFGQNPISQNCAQPQNVTKDYSVELFCEDFDEYVAPGSFVFGDLQHYAFNFTVTLDKTSLLIGEKAKAKLTLVNGGISYAKVFLNNSGFTWKSKNAAVASVSANGEVAGRSSGSTSIYASLPNRGTLPGTTVSVREFQSISKAEISGITAKTYNGEYQTQSPKVVLSGKTLKNGTDYKLTYKNNRNAGTASVTITGTGNYSGEKTVEFTIKKANQTVTATKSSATIEMGKSVTITGKGKGAITYTSANKKVATVTTKGVIKGLTPGTVKITIKAAGNSNYNAGKKVVTIKVVCPKPAISKATNSKSKTITVNWGKKTGVTGYQIQYCLKKDFKSNVKTVTVKGAGTTSKAIGSLTKGKTYYVRIRTYYNSTKTVSAWSAVKSVKIEK